MNNIEFNDLLELLPEGKTHGYTINRNTDFYITRLSRCMYKIHSIKANSKYLPDFHISLNKYFDNWEALLYKEINNELIFEQLGSYHLPLDSMKLEDFLETLPRDKYYKYFLDENLSCNIIRTDNFTYEITNFCNKETPLGKFSIVLVDNRINPLSLFGGWGAVRLEPESICVKFYKIFESPLTAITYLVWNK